MNRRNRFLPPLLSVLLAVGLSGCYQLYTEFVFDSDGNATMTHTHRVDSAVWDGDRDAASDYVWDFYASEDFDSARVGGSTGGTGSTVSGVFIVSGDQKINNFEVNAGNVEITRGIEARHKFVRVDTRIFTQVPEAYRQSLGGNRASVAAKPIPGWTFTEWSSSCELEPSGWIYCGTNTDNQEWRVFFKAVKDSVEPVTLVPVPGGEDGAPDVQVLPAPESEDAPDYEIIPRSNDEESTGDPVAGNDSDDLGGTNTSGGGASGGRYDDPPSSFADDADFADAYDDSLFDPAGIDVEELAGVDLEELAGVTAEDPNNASGAFLGIGVGVGLGALVAATIVWILRKKKQSTAEGIETSEDAK